MPRSSILLVLLLSGCASLLPPAGNEPVRARVVPVAPAVARERVTDRLMRDGFAVERTDDSFLTVSAHTAAARPAWVDCPYERAVDPTADDGRGTYQRAQSVRAVVVAQFGTLGGQTSASLDPTFVGQYLNPFTNTGFESRCASTGVLERELLDAASG